MKINPMQLIQMMKNGNNPQQLMLNLLQQNNNNPLMANLIQMAQSFSLIFALCFHYFLLQLLVHIVL